MTLRSSITALAKLPKFDLCMSTGRARFKAAALSFLLVAAFLLVPASAFADFRPDSSFQVDSFSAVPLAAIPVSGSLGTAYVTRAALGALGVQIASSLLDLTPDDVTKAMWYGGGSTLPPVFTYPNALSEYFSRETIRIRPGSVTIGGVEYSDVWLPHDAADKFRTNAFDFITRYNLVSESEGTFVSGVGFFDGIPIYYSQEFGYNSSTYTANNSVSVGNVSASYVHNGSTSTEFRYRGTINTTAGTRTGTGSLAYSTWTGLMGLRATQDVVYYGPISKNTGEITNAISYSASSLYVSKPFDFNWVSAVIHTDPLTENQGLRFRVPSTYVADLPQILDPSSETYQSDIASLISGVESSASDGTLTDPAFEEWDTPVPPASNTIADEPYSSLSGALSGISSFLNTISTSVSGIAESIISGDAGFFGNVVSALAAPFEPVFAIFRAGVGIWHYVVSWVGTISAPFSWSLSALGSAGSYFLSPIYAAAAAAVVLAVYKKFGR